MPSSLPRGAPEGRCERYVGTVGYLAIRFEGNVSVLTKHTSIWRPAREDSPGTWHPMEAVTMSSWHWHAWIIVRVPAPWWLRYACIVIWCCQYSKSDEDGNDLPQTLIFWLIDNILFFHIIFVVFIFFCYRSTVSRNSGIPNGVNLPSSSPCTISSMYSSPMSIAIFPPSR